MLREFSQVAQSSMTEQELGLRQWTPEPMFVSMLINGFSGYLINI